MGEVKIGDLVVCINEGILMENGRIYNVLGVSENTYDIKCRDNRIYDMNKSRFIPINDLLEE